jgi:hypothetical protein
MVPCGNMTIDQAIYDSFMQGVYLTVNKVLDE